MLAAPEFFITFAIATIALLVAVRLGRKHKGGSSDDSDSE